MRVRPRVLFGFLVSAVALILAGILAFGAVGAAGEPIQMAVDADPSSPTTVESTITITGTATFSLGINVTQVTSPQLYKGYQVEVQWLDSGLDWAGTTTVTTTSPFQLCQVPNSTT